MRVKSKTFAVVAGLAAFGSAAGIQGASATAAASAADVVKARQQNLKALETNMKPLAAIARGKADADAAAMAKHAKNIAAYAKKVGPSFALDTSKSGVKTEAKPSIWTSKADFTKKSAALVTASNQLAAVAGSGDMAKFRTALMGVGKACKDCHDTYRAK